jgi:ATP/maltotriose-dependent transcriptional regulator MalT
VSLTEFHRRFAAGRLAAENDLVRGVTAGNEIELGMVDAYQNTEIAEKFAISENTVKHHLTNIFHKVGVSKRLELDHHLDSSTL